MKRVWKEQQRSGWGIEGKDDTSINEVLERKCQFFWRLEEVCTITAQSYCGGSHQLPALFCLVDAVR